MITEDVRRELFAKQDTAYRDFQAKLIPQKDPGSVIGVRTPDIRAIAKDLVKRGDLEEFLSDLPHRYFDENQVHALTIALIKDYDTCMEEVKRFLPYVDNWATCDQMSPKVFKKHKTQLLEQIREWIASDHPYTVRFALGMLMQHFLDEDFDLSYARMAAGVRSGEYYINMMIAWYFATALAKQYEAVLPFLEERRLDPWVHNKTIQKAVESYRISEEQKMYLKTLKIPLKKGGEEGAGYGGSNNLSCGRMFLGNAEVL